jgi:hypothetical protein
MQRNKPFLNLQYMYFSLLFDRTKIIFRPQFVTKFYAPLIFVAKLC